MADSSRYHVESKSGSNSLTENPFPKYANRFCFAFPVWPWAPSYTYSKSSPLNSSNMWKKCTRLPGCSATTGPSSFPALNHDLPGADHAVRGMKWAMCSL